MEAPLLEFVQQRAATDNLLFTEYDGLPFIVGLKVRGTWVECDGRTYYIEGEIQYKDELGYYVFSKDGVMIPIKYFWTLYFQQ